MGSCSQSVAKLIHLSLESSAGDRVSLFQSELWLSPALQGSCYKLLLNKYEKTKITLNNI